MLLGELSSVATRSGRFHSLFSWQLRIMLCLIVSYSSAAFGQATCTWNQNSSGLWDIPANWNGCASGNGSPLGTPGPADHVIIGASTPMAEVIFDAPDRTVARLTVAAGQLTGSSTLTISTELNWTGGGLSATPATGAALVLASSATGTMSDGQHQLRERILRNFGVLTWTGGDIELNSNAVLDNQGSLIINIPGAPSPPVSLLGDFSGGNLLNSATPGSVISKTGLGVAKFENGMVFENLNAVQVNAGTMVIAASGDDSGSYQIAAGSFLDFAPHFSEFRSLTGIPSISGTGVLRKLGEGNLEVAGSFPFTGQTQVLDGQLEFNTASPVSFPQLQVSSPGKLNGNVDFEVSGNLQWIGGDIRGSGGTLTLLATATATVSLDDINFEATLIGRNWINQGSVLVTGTGSGPLSAKLLLDNASIDNQGAFELRSNNHNNLILECAFDVNDCGGFSNRLGATLTLNDIQGIVVIGESLTSFDNDGLVDFVHGCAQINPPGVDTGTYRYNTTCTLAFFTRNGTERVLESTVVLDELSGSTLQLEGRLRLNGASRTLGNFLLEPAGTLLGPAAITLSGNAEWRGTIEGSSTSDTITIGALGSLNTGTDSADSPTLRSRLLINDGALTIHSAVLGFDADPQIINNGSLALTASASSPADITCLSPSFCGSLINAGTGTITSSSNAGGSGPMVTIAPDIGFDQQGVIEVSAGVLNLEANLVAAPGSILRVMANAVLNRSLGGPLVLAGGTLTGDGVVRADVQAQTVNIAPGSGLGGLTINGSFSATGSTTYNMQIGGVAPPQRQNNDAIKMPPAQYDRLTISGPAVLAGTVNVINAGYTPSPSDTFVLFSYANYSGVLNLGANPHPGFMLDVGATRTRFAQNPSSVCEWNPAGLGADNWTNDQKWNNCGSGVGPGPGPAGTPGASDSVLIAAGSVNLDVPVAVDALELTGGAVIGTSDLSITGELIWTGGMLAGSSGSEVLVDMSAIGLLAGGQKVLDTRNLRIAGTATWTTGLIELSNAAMLSVDASAELITRPSAAPEQIYAMGTGIARVSNFGTLRKEGAGISGIADSVEYVGSGDVIVDQGEFILAASSSIPMTGQFIANLGMLRFIGASRSFDSGSTLGGAGLMVFGDMSGASSINQVDGCFNNPTNIRVESAQLSINCSSPTVLDYLNLAHPGSVLDGSSAISVIGQMEWNHGEIGGSGPGSTIELASGANGTLGYLVSPFAGRLLNNRQFINHGVLLWTGKNPLSLESGAELRNEADGQLRIMLPPGSDTELLWDSSAGTRLLNLGIIDVDAANQFRIDAHFDQSGSVNINAGTTRIVESGVDGGAYTLAAGTTLAFNGPNAVRNLGSGSSVTGSGAFQVEQDASVVIDNVPFSPARVALLDSGTLQIDSITPVSIAEWFIDDGVVTGSADLSAENQFTWLSGTIGSTLPTAAPFVVSPGATLLIQGLPFFPRPGVDGGPIATINHFLSQRDLQIQGHANWNEGEIRVLTGTIGRLTIAAGGNLDFTATVGSQVFACILAACTAEIDVLGTLHHLGTSTTLQTTSPIAVSGSLLVDAGDLITSNIVQTAGVISVADGSSLGVTNLTMNGGVLSGRGTVAGNVTNLAGSIEPGNSPGALAIFGNYVHGASATLQIQLAGLNAGFDADFLLISGAATLQGGNLSIIDAGFTPTPPQSYEFLNSDAMLTGTFANVTVPYAGYGVTYTGNSATLSPQVGPIVVNSTVDPGDGSCNASECTLREAIALANSTPGPDIIQFAIPGGSCVGAGGACVIAPTSPLPAITDGVLIDGYSQPGSAPNTHTPGMALGTNAVLKVEIDGSMTTAANGLVINAPSTNVSIVGLAIHSFLGNVQTQGPGDANYVIAGNFIGLRADGSVPGLAPGVGISVQGGNTFIGDSTAAGMNVISGNQQQGIVISNVPMLASVVIHGNLIGTDPSGMLPAPNGLQGILATTSSHIQGIYIGGSLPDERNVISGNTQDGVRFDCFAVSDVCFDGARVSGNLIGPAADASPMGNMGHGVNLASMNGGQVFIGGTAPGQSNLIGFNGGNGITATFGGFGKGTFQRNGYLFNLGQGIDLGNDGRTANDANDADSGPNELLNFPYFTSYVLAGTGDSADFAVTLDTPNLSSNYPVEVELYWAFEDEPSVYLGSMSCALPNSPCLDTIVFPPGVVLTPNHVVLGVVVDGFGQTSEASFYRSATSIVADSPDPSDIGVPYDVDVQVSSPDPFVPTGLVDIADGQGNTCTAFLSNSGSGYAAGTCQLPTTGPSGATLTLTASYAGIPEPFSASSDADSHSVNASPQPPVITLISPVNGSVTGGTVVTITGSNFVVGATSFDFGGAAGTSVACSSVHQCTVTSPAGTGTVNISASTIVGVSADTPADDFRYLAGPPLLCSNVTQTGSFATGGTPYTLAAGDFNGDGRRDLAVVISEASGRVAILLANGSGGFSAATSYSVDPFPRSITVGDFNEDGRSDLAVANYGSTTVSILMGTGAGLFAPAVPIAVGSGPHAVAVGDFNGDGHADLAVAVLDADSLAILLGTGTGTFGAPTISPSLRSISVVVSDFDADGRSDVALGNRTTDAVSVLLGDGMGAFGATVDYPTSPSPNAIGIGDFDGDGYPDMAVISGFSANSVSVFMGGIGGVFANPITYPVGNQPTGIDVGDFDTDGILDLVVSNAGSGDVSFLRGLAGGNFDTATSFGGLNSPRGLVMDDFDGDGYADLAVLNNFTGVTLLRNSGCPPTITVILPDSGPESGGTAVNIIGTGFVPGATSVAFGSTAASSVSCTSALQCVATSPPGSGTVNISVTTEAGTSLDTPADDFDYKVVSNTSIVSISPEPSVVGQPYTVTANVTAGGFPVAVGSVVIQQLSDGSSCTYSLKSATGCQLVATSAITTAVQAYYSGAPNLLFSASPVLSHVVNRAVTEIQIISDTPDPSAGGQPITVSIDVAVLAPGAGTPTGEILITDGSASCGITLPQQSCSFVPKALGLITLQAHYQGDANFALSSDTEEHTVTVDGADLSIIKRNGLRLLPAGQPSTYVLLVNNAGPQDVVGARVTDLLPPQLSNGSWTCSSTGGATCPASGVGTVDALVNMPSGSSVTFLLTVTVQASPEQVVTNRAIVTPPTNAPDPLPANNESIDVDPMGLFGDGWEDENE